MKCYNCDEIIKEDKYGFASLKTSVIVCPECYLEEKEEMEKE